jgi:hypothetical protein
MASNQMHNSTDLIPRLNERGITLSRPQVYRLVHQRPEVASTKVVYESGPDPGDRRVVAE